MTHTTGFFHLCYVDELGATWSLLEDEVLLPDKEILETKDAQGHNDGNGFTVKPTSTDPIVGE